MTKLTAMLGLVLIAGCTEGSSSSRPPDLIAFGSDGLGFTTVDAGQRQETPSLTPDSAGKPDSSKCAFGNLLAALPAQPVLCRPFAPPQPTMAPADPPGCQAGAQLVLGDGPDTFVGTDTAKDHVLGMGGDDVLKGMGCSDELNGNQGNDQVNGNAGNDIVQGGQGNDTVHGGADNDQLTGGLDDDLLHGDLGDDEYYFSEGDGSDVIEETGGYDRIICAPISGRPAAKLVSWQRSGDDLLLLMSAGSSIRVKGYFVNPEGSIDAVVGC